MPRRLTIDVVRAMYASEGYTLLSQEYLGVRHKHLVRCPQGHEFNLLHRLWLQGTRCHGCSGYKRKLTYADAVKDLENDGHSILSKESEFIDGNSVITILCNKGHIITTPYAHWRSRRSCRVCASEGRQKYKTADIPDICKRLDLTYLSHRLDKSLKASRRMVSYRCNTCGYESESYLNSLVNATNGCINCVGHIKHEYLKIKNDIEIEGYILNSKSYKNARTRLSITCPKGHTYQAIYDSWRRGSRCSQCAECGFKKDKPAILYYLRIEYEGNLFYKVGITNQTIQKRFRKEFDFKYTVLMAKTYQIGEYALRDEQCILDTYDKYRCSNIRILKNGGNTEIFTKDVLGLDV